jgi:methionine aminotransferase
LTIEFGVAAIPSSVLNHRGDDLKVLRFCFAKKEKTFTAAAERLNAV